jgi:hypothetical protein
MSGEGTQEPMFSVLNDIDDSAETAKFFFENLFLCLYLLNGF